MQLKEFKYPYIGIFPQIEPAFYMKKLCIYTAEIVTYYTNPPSQFFYTIDGLEDGYLQLQHFKCIILVYQRSHTIMGPKLRIVDG